MNKEDLLTLTPVTDYQAPDLPTFATVKPEILKRMPSRWRNKTLVATVGLLGIAALAGCSVNEEIPQLESQYQGEYSLGQINRTEPHELVVGLHFGGFGGAPIYVAHLTEQEVREFILTNLTAAGLNFDESMERYFVAAAEFGGTYFDHFDSERRVGIINLSWSESTAFGGGIHSTSIPYGGPQEWVEQMVNEDIVRQELGITFGLFTSLGYHLDWDYEREINPEEATEIAPILVENLDEQIQAFIERLRNKGIID